MPDQLTLSSQIKDVPLSKIRVSPNVQRALRPSRVAYLISEFDPEQFGYPVVNLRDGHYFNVDGQHRLEAVKAWLGDGWEKQSVTCRVYSGMSEKEEANMFDRLNNQLTVTAFDKFKTRVTAGRAVECAVKKTVEREGLHISREKKPGNVSSVGVLVKVYERSNAQTLGRALRLVNTAFGDPGMTTSVIDGIALLCERYNGELKDDDAIRRLQEMRGGIGALMSKAATLRKQTAASVPVCIAAATVDVLNARKGGKKLPSWWKYA